MTELERALMTIGVLPEAEKKSAAAGLSVEEYLRMVFSGEFEARRDKQREEVFKSVWNLERGELWRAARFTDIYDVALQDSGVDKGSSAYKLFLMFCLTRVMDVTRPSVRSSRKVSIFRRRALSVQWSMSRCSIVHQRHSCALSRWVKWRSSLTTQWSTGATASRLMAGVRSHISCYTSGSRRLSRRFRGCSGRTLTGSTWRYWLDTTRVMRFPIA